MLKIVKFKQEEIPSYIPYGLENAPCILYGIHDKPFAWICKEELCNYDYLKKRNIPYINIDGNGSTIITAEGDIDFGFFGSKEFCEEQFYKLSNYISKLLTNGKFLNNDFMYDGNKYGSATKIEFGEITYIGVHISNNIDKELINNICLKKCYKIPEKMPIPLLESDVEKIFKEE